MSLLASQTSRVNSADTAEESTAVKFTGFKFREPSFFCRRLLATSPDTDAIVSTDTRDRTILHREGRAPARASLDGLHAEWPMGKEEARGRVLLPKSLFIREEISASPSLRRSS